jgi:hypothetical protein
MTTFNRCPNCGHKPGSGFPAGSHINLRECKGNGSLRNGKDLIAFREAVTNGS